MICSCFLNITQAFYQKLKDKSTDWVIPKSTACICDISENKMPGGETY
jgi:hypothetical protein